MNAKSGERKVKNREKKGHNDAWQPKKKERTYEKKRDWEIMPPDMKRIGKKFGLGQEKRSGW